MDVIHWRHNGESKVVIQLEDITKARGASLIMAYAVNSAYMTEVRRLFLEWTNGIKDVVKTDYKDRECYLPNGKRLVLKAEKRVRNNAITDVLGLSKEMGVDILASPAIDAQKLKKAMEENPEFAKNVKPYLEPYGEHLQIVGREIKLVENSLDEPIPEQVFVGGF